MIHTFWHTNPGEKSPKFWAYADNGTIYFGSIVKKPTIQTKPRDYGPNKMSEKHDKGYFQGPSLETEDDLLATLGALRALHAGKTGAVGVSQVPSISPVLIEELSNKLGIVGSIQWIISAPKVVTPATSNTDWTW